MTDSHTAEGTRATCPGQVRVRPRARQASPRPDRLLRQRVRSGAPVPQRVAFHQLVRATPVTRGFRRPGAAASSLAITCRTGRSKHWRASSTRLCSSQCDRFGGSVDITISSASNYERASPMASSGTLSPTRHSLPVRMTPVPPGRLHHGGVRQRRHRRCQIASGAGGCSGREQRGEVHRAALGPDAQLGNQRRAIRGLVGDDEHALHGQRSDLERRHRAA
jgi:hypothetical protein